MEKEPAQKVYLCSRLGRGPEAILRRRANTRTNDWAAGSSLDVVQAESTSRLSRGSDVHLGFHRAYQHVRIRRRGAHAAAKRMPARRRKPTSRWPSRPLMTTLPIVSENTLLKEQDTLDIRNLRKELLKSALPFYRKFVKEHSHDPQASRAARQRLFIDWVT